MQHSTSKISKQWTLLQFEKLHNKSVWKKVTCLLFSTILVYKIFLWSGHLHTGIVANIKISKSTPNFDINVGFFYKCNFRIPNKTLLGQERERVVKLGRRIRTSTLISSPVGSANCSPTHEIRPIVHVKQRGDGYRSKMTLSSSVNIFRNWNHFIYYNTTRIHAVSTSCFAVF